MSRICRTCGEERPDAKFQRNGVFISRICHNCRLERDRKSRALARIKCTKCGELKARDCYRVRNGRISATCKACELKQQREYRNAHREALTHDLINEEGASYTAKSGDAAREKKWSCADAAVASREYLKCAKARDAWSWQFIPLVRHWALEAASTDDKASAERIGLTGAVAAAESKEGLRAALEALWANYGERALPDSTWEGN